jgi:TM2 domain-containing membrane protein YozV
MPLIGAFVRFMRRFGLIDFGEGIRVRRKMKGRIMSGGAEIIFVLIALAIYFLPTIIGSRRGLASQGGLFFVNLILGWTIIGWLACFIWAATGATVAQDRFYRDQVRPGSAPDPNDPAFREAYARERARLDHEAATGGARPPPTPDFSQPPPKYRPR